jgi:hypothetical protein
MKEIEHEANLAVHHSDSKFWKRWMKDMRNAKTESSFKRLEQIAEEQRVTESYDKLLANLKRNST